MKRLTEDAVADLPPPVRRCLQRLGVVGRALPRGVSLRQTGRIRTSAESKWLTFAAEQTYTVVRPGFFWNARLRIGPLTVGRAIDSHEAGHGRMHVKLLGMINVVDARGPELDQGTLLRWLNETMFFPSVWGTDVVSWQAVDGNTAVGSVTDGDLTVAGEFRFDSEDRLIDFRADRYRDVDGAFEMTPWSTPLREHAIFNGIELPSLGSGVWKLPDGEFEYIQLEVLDVTYT